MASYRVFEFANALPTAKAAGEDVCFVRDGFAVAALVFPAIWLLWHRLWLSFALLLLLMALFLFIADMSSPLLVVFLNSLVGFYLGFEGTNLKAIKLKNTGWHEVDIVVARDLEDAEIRYFLRRSAGVSDHEKPMVALSTEPLARVRAPLPSKNRPVIGGFPSQPVGSRS